MKIEVDEFFIKYPDKLKWREEEIIEFVKELNPKKNDCVKVWETKRHDLCTMYCR